MTIKKTTLLAAALLGLAMGHASAQSAQPAQQLERIEPANWWVGMQNQRLQLMLHGQGIAELKARLRSYAGVRMLGSQRSDSPNYLFLDLEIQPGARPGNLQLELQRAGKTVLSPAYPLWARVPGSARRQGFGPRDAIYLVVPDRFANGEPRNDQLDALGDRLDRGNPSARHGGDLAGLAQHLDYIAAMGFTQVWPTPLLENKQPELSYHGYSPTDLYKIDPRFGSNEDYRQLVARAKTLGLGFIQDIVPNHIGSGHWWMQDPPSRDWVNPGQPYLETNHRHSTVQDPYAAASDRQRFQDGWFVPSMPDLNQRQPLLATYLVQNAVWWIEYAGLSGLRVDTYPYSDKAFLARWSAAIMAEYPGLTMVGEEMSDNPLMVAHWLKGRRNADGYVSAMPSMMDFPLHGRLRDALTEPEGRGYGVGLGKLYEAMMNDALYPEPARMVLFEGNHDTNRIFSALGEDEALMRMAATVIATTRRTPQFFYGTELLMKSPLERDDGVVRSDFAGGWAGDASNGFSGVGLAPAQREFQAWLRRLLNWRKTASAVHGGSLVHYNPLDGVYVYFRADARQRVMVVLNKNKTETPLGLARFAESLAGRTHAVDVISGQRHELGSSLNLPPRSSLVLELQ